MNFMVLKCFYFDLKLVMKIDIISKLNPLNIKFSPHNLITKVKC